MPNHPSPLAALAAVAAVAAAAAAAAVPTQVCLIHPSLTQAEKAGANPRAATRSVSSYLVIRIIYKRTSLQQRAIINNITCLLFH